MRRVLTTEENAASWSARASDVLNGMRAEHNFLDEGPAPLVEHKNEITWWTFAGGGANILLARMLEAELGERCVSRNLSITLKKDAAKSALAVRQFIDLLTAEQRPNASDLAVHAEAATRGRVSKFQVCLPDSLLQQLLSLASLDPEGARRLLGG